MPQAHRHRNHRTPQQAASRSGKKHAPTAQKNVPPPQQPQVGRPERPAAKVNHKKRKRHHSHGTGAHVTYENVRIAQYNCESCPNDMGMHWAFFTTLDAQIIILTETKLSDPPELFPPPSMHQWHALHIPAREMCHPVGTSDSLRGGNSGGVTILVSYSLGIVATIDNVIVDHYAQTVTLHPPQWEMPMVILASYIPPIGP